jgi:hypothetical protein
VLELTFDEKSGLQPLSLSEKDRHTIIMQNEA